MMAVMCLRTVVMLSPERCAIAPSFSPWAIISRTACWAGVSRPADAAPRSGLSGVARSHNISKYSRSAEMITGARITSAPGRAGRGEREHRGGVVGELHLHRHPRQQPRLLPRVHARLDDPPGDRVVHRRGVVDGPAPDPAVVRGQRQLREIVGDRHVGVQVLQRHPVPACGVRQRCRQFADLGPVRDHADHVLREPPVHPDPEPGLRVGEAMVPVNEEFLFTGEPVLVAGQDALQRQVR